MSESQKKILELLENKKITVDEAQRLLGALRGEEGHHEAHVLRDRTARPSRGKYLRVTVQPDPEHEGAGDVDRVNVRVPMSLIRSGMKFTSLLPDQARDKVSGALREKGIDFDMRNLKPEDFDELIEALSELEVDVRSSDGEMVKVFVE
ncbi:MAG: SHOCT-like domain-containing protein [Dehalococcoidia bacterium]